MDMRWYVLYCGLRRMRHIDAQTGRRGRYLCFPCAENSCSVRSYDNAWVAKRSVVHMRCWLRCVADAVPNNANVNLREYKVIGRSLPTAKIPAPPLYRMRIFAPNHVVAKSRFWYFVSQLKKMKKASGEIVYCGQVFEKSPQKVKNFGIWLRYDSRSGTHNMYREYRDLTTAGAVTLCYRDMGARHRARAHSIHIMKVEVIPANKCRRPAIKQFHAGIAIEKLDIVGEVGVKLSRPVTVTRYLTCDVFRIFNDEAALQWTDCRRGAVALQDLACIPSADHVEYHVHVTSREVLQRDCTSPAICPLKRGFIVEDPEHIACEDSKIKFPLPHRVLRRQHKPRFTTKRPNTFF
ncbi:unnamed protein product [Ranitomeya imitator]|uniref:Large ribosomal subunit protein eL20 n=1 Tax=Ranitomeya imitator TaxID=111125 RepID=A0ABN9KX27_9NEOB|nr:unnamed protein product [Ranitomeya imitator]